MTCTRGTDHSNERGSAEARRKRVAWLIEAFASNVLGYARCYRCGVLLYDRNNPPENLYERESPWMEGVTYTETFDGERCKPLTVDRIIPGCDGGTYKRTNIRPACEKCNCHEVGSRLRSTKKKTTKITRMKEAA